MRFFLLSLLFCFASLLKAVDPSISDTFYIEEVSVVSSATGKYQVGVHSHSYTTEKLESHGGANLNSLLSQTMPVYIKSDAGGLSSIRLRGTAPDHTAIMVGGVNINSLTLGYSNASTVPTYLFDELSVQLGNSSAEVGSGAIGGTVKLGLLYQWTDGVKVRATSAAGSFGEYLGGVKLFWGNGKFEHVLRLYDYRKENDFTYTYKYRGVEHEATQNFASLHNRGVLNEINYKFDEAQYLTSFIWFENNVHDKQPTISDNSNNQVDPGHLESKNIRSWVEYHNKKAPIAYKIGGGYVRDHQIDNGNDNQAIGTERIEFNAQVDRDLDYWGKLSGGTHYRYIVPHVYAYQENLIEHQTELYLSYIKAFGAHLQVSANMRQQWVTDFDAPLIPSLGINYSTYITSSSTIALLGNASRNYRIPSLNDRFWGVDSTYLGNPNLKAEEGYSLEMGLKYMYSGDIVDIKSHIQGFWMDIDDWIMWLPRGMGYEAVNIQRVLSKGLEMSNTLDIKLNTSWTINTGLNYTYNPVIRKESNNTGDNLDMQLEYVPKHVGNLWLAMKYNSTGAELSGNYTGLRNASQSGDVLDAFLLMNAEITHEIKHKQSRYSIGLRGENLLNSSYQNQLNYAMPGRSFRILLNYIFN